MTDSPRPLAKLETIIRLMRMTTSNFDNEALLALRKANDFLSAEGWDWEALLRNKITIVEDPFKGLSSPVPSNGRAPAPPPPPRQRPQTAPPPPRARRSPAQAAQQAHQQAKAQMWQASATQPTQSPSRPNLYAGSCSVCNTYVMPQSGMVEKQFGRWVVFCTSCNTRRKAGTASPQSGLGGLA